jgi:type II secretory pathway component PulM
MALAPEPTPRLRRWLLGGGVLVVLLGAYGATVHQLSERIADDVEDAVRVAPVLDEMTPRAD